MSRDNTETSPALPRAYHQQARENPDEVRVGNAIRALWGFRAPRGLARKRHGKGPPRPAIHTPKARGRSRPRPRPRGPSGRGGPAAAQTPADPPRWAARAPSRATARGGTGRRAGRHAGSGGGPGCVRGRPGARGRAKPARVAAAGPRRPAAKRAAGRARSEAKRAKQRGPGGPSGPGGPLRRRGAQKVGEDRSEARTAERRQRGGTEAAAAKARPLPRGPSLRSHSRHTQPITLVRREIVPGGRGCFNACDHRRTTEGPGPSSAPSIHVAPAARAARLGPA